MTEVAFDRWSAVWNDDFARIYGEDPDVPLFHRGCDPSSNTSFATFIQVRTEALDFVGTTRCWDAAGRPLSCAAVDLEPGLE